MVFRETFAHDIFHLETQQRIVPFCALCSAQDRGFWLTDSNHLHVSRLERLVQLVLPRFDIVFVAIGHVRVGTLLMLVGRVIVLDGIHDDGGLGGNV